METLLQSVKLKDFQSLANAEVELGQFTAIIGPSNTGKTALVRAIRALARNAPAPGLVREGKSKFVVEAKFSDGTVETLTKGKSVSEFDIDGKTWAKAGGSSVPEEVAQLWSLPDFCITSQHDAPFLLAEPASVVAKTLGELTNAAMLMEAVREANKRRTDALANEKARNREVQEGWDEIQTHAGLSVRTKAVEAAREALSVARQAYQRFSALEQLCDAYQEAAENLEFALLDLSRTPDAGQAVVNAEGCVKKLLVLEKLIDMKSAAERQIEQATEAGTAETIARSEAEAEIHNLLSDAGYCPLCRQGVI